jgi:hypothetical protein
LLCSPGWPHIPGPPASASWVLELQAWTTTPGLNCFPSPQGFTRIVPQRECIKLSSDSRGRLPACPHSWHYWILACFIFVILRFHSLWENIKRF